MPLFSARSIAALNTCDDEFKLICYALIRDVNFSVLEGHRDERRQNMLFEAGASKLKWPYGNHNAYPSRAIDIAPYVPPYGLLLGDAKQISNLALETDRHKWVVESFIVKTYARLIGHFEREARRREIGIRVGLDWDGDWSTLDQSFDDLGHIELR